jgi:hypothetical protein
MINFKEVKTEAQQELEFCVKRRQEYLEERKAIIEALEECNKLISHSEQKQTALMKIINAINELNTESIQP